MSSGETTRIKAVPLTQEGYEPYGKIIAAHDSSPFCLANMGTAKRFNHLCDLVNLRPAKAKLNLCIFRCSPLPSLPLEMRLLEKHHFSTQVFMPMSNDCKYLAIVCLGTDKPNLDTLTAFLVQGAQGVSYYPGVWHYPMSAIDSAIDFSCLVFEDGTESDCTVAELEKPILIQA